jgi:hypothetical protein
VSIKRATETGNGTGLTGRVIVRNGCQIREVIVRIAYARNGNTHNPTKEKEWLVYSPSGTYIDRAVRLRDAKVIADETEVV